MADWSDLQKDLVLVVADLLLTTNDVDGFVDMRAVCHNWRVAIPKPTPLGAGDDRRFRPRDWVMLDEKEPEDGVSGRLFLNVSTGRFVRRRLPSIGFDCNSKYILVAASDGLLILGDQKGLHDARLLNPFTGHMLSFAAPIPREPWVVGSVAGFSPSPTLLFSFIDNYEDLVNCADLVYCADATSWPCEVQFEGCEGKDVGLGSIVSYAGDLYMVNGDGEIFKIVGTAPNYQGEMIAKIIGGFLDCSFCLVGSAGELLLVTLRFNDDTQDVVDVFRVNIERKELEHVRNIGSRSLFLGSRCLSVNADKLTSVDCNCIYYTPPSFGGWDTICKYDLNDSKVETIPFVSYLGTTAQVIRPFSLAQALIGYCVRGELEDIPSQLERVRQY